MNKKHRSMLLALVAFVGLVLTVQAQTREEIKVNLPFEFTVGGKTLPSGTYTVSRIADDKHSDLLLINRETRTSVLVHSVEVKSASADMPNVSFERVGEARFLTRIATSYDVYTIPVSRSMIMEARMKQTNATSASAASGSN